MVIAQARILFFVYQISSHVISANSFRWVFKFISPHIMAKLSAPNLCNQVMGFVCFLNDWLVNVPYTQAFRQVRVISTTLRCLRQESSAWVLHEVRRFIENCTLNYQDASLSDWCCLWQQCCCLVKSRGFQAYCGFVKRLKHRFKLPELSSNRYISWDSNASFKFLLPRNVL